MNLNSVMLQVVNISNDLIQKYVSIFDELGYKNCQFQFVGKVELTIDMRISIQAMQISAPFITLIG